VTFASQNQWIVNNEWAMPAAADIHARVAHLLAEVLAVDKEHITPTAALQRDLGADSLDLLEIKFRLEQEFGIDISPEEFFPKSILPIGPEWVEAGSLTPKGLTELRSRLPYVDLGEFQVDRPLEALSALCTADLVTAYIQWKLGRGAKQRDEQQEADLDEDVEVHACKRHAGQSTEQAHRPATG
jgi:acyl carrier protein